MDNNSKNTIIRIGIIPIISTLLVYLFAPRHFYAETGIKIATINAAISLIVTIVLIKYFKNKLKYVFAIINILLSLFLIISFLMGGY